MSELERHIRNIPDFPKPGIQFKDITPLLADPAALKIAVNQLVDTFKNAGIQKVVGIEARGFLLGTPVAMALDAGFVPIRKPGKLPYQTIRHTYTLEYGTDTIEMHMDAIKPGENVLIIDDLLATGGTVQAACALVERMKGNIAGIGFLIELEFLKGKEKISGYPTHSLIKF